MNNKFDELTRSLAESVTRRAALKKFGVGLAGMALSCFGLANKAGAARRSQAYCEVTRGGFGSNVYTGMCIDIERCVSGLSADCPTSGFAITPIGTACGSRYASQKRCSFAI